MEIFRQRVCTHSFVRTPHSVSAFSLSPLLDFFRKIISTPSNIISTLNRFSQLVKTGLTWSVKVRVFRCIYYFVVTRTNLSETAKFYVEVMNSKQQKEGKFGNAGSIQVCLPFVVEAYTPADVYSLLISESSFQEYILQRPSSFVPYNWRFFVDLSKKRLVLYQLPGSELMVDNASKRKNRFALCQVFVGVPLPWFQTVIQSELELLRSVDIVSLSF